MTTTPKTTDLLPALSNEALLRLLKRIPLETEMTRSPLWKRLIKGITDESNEDVSLRDPRRYCDIFKLAKTFKDLDPERIATYAIEEVDGSRRIKNADASEIQILLDKVAGMITNAKDHCTKERHKRLIELYWYHQGQISKLNGDMAGYAASNAIALFTHVPNDRAAQTLMLTINGICMMATAAGNDSTVPLQAMLNLRTLLADVTADTQWYKRDSCAIIIRAYELARVEWIKHKEIEALFDNLMANDDGWFWNYLIQALAMTGEEKIQELILFVKKHEETESSSINEALNLARLTLARAYVAANDLDKANIWLGRLLRNSHRTSPEYTIGKNLLDVTMTPAI